MPQGPELLIIVGLVVLLFGGSQLPKLARSLGEARKEFERGNAEAEAEAKGRKAPDGLPASTPDADARAAELEREAELARREAEIARREADLQRRRDS